MRVGTTTSLVALTLLGFASAANADAILLTSERVTALSSLSWLQPDGDLRKDAESFRARDEIDPFRLTGSVGVGGIPLEELPNEFTELSASANYSRDLGLSMGIRTNRQGCQAGIQCWNAAEIKMRWDFTVDGVETYVQAGGDDDYGSNFELSLYDRTAKQFVTQFQGIGIYDLDHDLVDGHSYTLLVSMYTTRIGTNESQYYLWFADRMTNEVTSIQAAPVPEPVTLLLLGAGVSGMAVRRRRFGRRDTNQRSTSRD